MSYQSVFCNTQVFMRLKIGITNRQSKIEQCVLFFKENFEHTSEKNIMIGKE